MPKWKKKCQSGRKNSGYSYLGINNSILEEKRPFWNYLFQFGRKSSGCSKSGIKTSILDEIIPKWKEKCKSKK